MVIELQFLLRQDQDGWPPFSVEGLWCEPRGTLFEVKTCPYVVSGISLGDVISVQFDDNNEVIAYEVVEASDNSTIWVIFWDQSIAIQILDELDGAGCETKDPIDGWSVKLCAVSVPSETSMSDIDLILGPLEIDGKIAVATPSMRHN